MANNPWDDPSFGEDTLPVLRPREMKISHRHGPPVDVAGRTDIGLVRRHNEDSFLIANLGRWLEVRDSNFDIHEAASRIPGPHGLLMMVADGMGGHGGGEVASAVAVDVIAQFALYAMPWTPRPNEGEERQLLEKLGEAMNECQTRLRRIAVRKQIDALKPGTTLTVAYALWPKLYIGHAGDSRVYLERQGELTQITKDHTVGQVLRDRGALGAGPSRLDHVLVNVVGGGGGKVKVEAHAITLQTGDHVLLCSDGLTGHVGDERIRDVLRDANDSKQASEQLVDDARADGGGDNITVVVASF